MVINKAEYDVHSIEIQCFLYIVGRSRRIYRILSNDILLFNIVRTIFFVRKQVNTYFDGYLWLFYAIVGISFNFKLEGNLYHLY